MADRNHQHEPNAAPPPPRFHAGVVVVALLVVAGVCFWRHLLLLPIWLVLGIGTSRAVPSSEVAGQVTRSLSHWGVLGAVPDVDPDHRNFVDAIASQMRGVNGVRYSSGIHGDGTDWYELELSAALAERLRTALASSPNVAKATGFSGDSSAPSWWPSEWPADAQFYCKDLEYLVLPKTGRRAWFMRVRT